MSAGPAAKADPVRLRQAARLIRATGLAKGQYAHNGRHCAVGALLSVSTHRSFEALQPDFELVASLIDNPEDKRSSLPAEIRLVAFNDLPSTGQEDVAGLFDRAAEIAEASR